MRHGRFSLAVNVKTDIGREAVKLARTQWSVEITSKGTGSICASSVCRVTFLLHLMPLHWVFILYLYRA